MVDCRTIRVGEAAWEPRAKRCREEKVRRSCEQRGLSSQPPSAVLVGAASITYEDEGEGEDGQECVAVVEYSGGVRAVAVAVCAVCAPLRGPDGAGGRQTGGVLL